MFLAKPFQSQKRLLAGQIAHTAFHHIVVRRSIEQRRKRLITDIESVNQSVDLHIAARQEELPVNTLCQFQSKHRADIRQVDPRPEKRKQKFAAKIGSLFDPVLRLIPVDRVIPIIIPIKIKFTSNTR